MNEETNSSVYTIAYNGNEVLNLTDLGEGTIRDNISGLLWQKYHSGRKNNASYSDDVGELDTVSLQNALQYCDSLILASFADWRLPNRNELVSLVDYSIPGTSKFDTSIFLGSASSEQMWSSNTRSVTGTTFSLWVNANFGILTTGNATNKNQVNRCVREP